MKKPKDKWKPDRWGTEKHGAILENLKVIRGATNALERSIVRNSINMDLDYDNLLIAVEAMYAILELDKLALDNARRRTSHMQKVREVENRRAS